MPGTNILIVGSGIAGATVAAGLRARGIGPIVMLEAGPGVEMRSQRRWLDYLTTGVRPYDDCRDSAADAGLPARSLAWLRDSRLFARGGSTLHWGGWSLRFRPEDFVLRSATGRGMDWPLGYADLEPWYGEAERFLGVAGDSADRSLTRSAAYPFGPLPFTQVDAELIRGFDALGYSYAPMPIARNVEQRDGQSACQSIGTCKYCPIGARYTADQTLDRLSAGPDFELRLNAAARAIVLDRHDHAAAVEYLEVTSGQTRRIEADHVILCAGAIETPAILRNSTSSYWPKGVGNASGHVGRHLIFHPLLFARGMQSANPRRLQHELDFPTLCSRHFDTADEQAAGKLFLFLPPVHPRLDLAARMKAGQSSVEVRRGVTGRYELELQGFMEIAPRAPSTVVPGAGRNRFGLPTAEVQYPDVDPDDPPLRHNLQRMEGILAAAGYGEVRTGVFAPRGDHAAATCRMARSDGDGVVGADLRVHGIDNLYVCSNAVFPSGGAVNPTLTLAALAMRFAAQLAAEQVTAR